MTAKSRRDLKPPRRDPVKINNYNRFLSTLDKGGKEPTYHRGHHHHPRHHRHHREDDTKQPPNTHDTNKIGVKDDIDKILEAITLNFSINNRSSFFMIGSGIINFVDPNEYDDQLKVASETKPCRRARRNANAPKPPVEKTNVHIDAQIHSIADILLLADTYPVDPSICYNIDMQAIHDIHTPLQALHRMVGMQTLKENVVDQILYFVQGLHKNKDASGEFLHTVIYGPPGTGKTEIAKIMGSIYSHIGVLSKGTFKKVTRSDLVAGYLGQTALKTKEVVKEALGGVLFIDEAYSLGDTEKRDSFAKECIDTLCECASDFRDDLMIIVAGYEKELTERFFSFNQGLDSRFTWRFKTDEYTYEDLYRIFLKKVEDIGWTTDDAIGADWFKKHKECFRFYGRDMESLLSKSKIAHSRRVFGLPDSDKKRLTVTDLDKGFQTYMSNDDIKRKQEEEAFKRHLYSTLYT